MKKKGTWKKVVIAIVAVCVIGGAINAFGNGDSSGQVANDSNSEPVQTTAQTETKEESQSGVTGVEVQKDNPYGEIDEFDYEISGDEVILDEFDGKNKVLEIKPSYEVDGKEYKTNLSEFYLSGSDVETLILYDGISEVNTAMFNMSDVNKVFFPKTMENVYDYTLAYLHPDDGQMIQIYYEGTQDEWSEIFTEYKRTKVEDAEGAEEIGTAIADKINDMIGTEYDSSKFEFFFLASPDDLK